VAERALVGEEEAASKRVAALAAVELLLHALPKLHVVRVPEDVDKFLACWLCVTCLGRESTST